LGRTLTLSLILILILTVTITLTIILSLTLTLTLTLTLPPPGLKADLTIRLAKSKEEEKAYRDAKGLPQDPLTVASIMMALTPKEMKRFQTVFSALDTDRQGFITIQTLFEEIEEPETNIGRDIFASVDALDPRTEGLSFGDFMKAISVYCFYGQKEMIKTVFTFADKDCVGQITTEQFASAMFDINNQDKRSTIAILLDLG
jgi:Ca2+-binding EF-hand superfamily protein